MFWILDHCNEPVLRPATKIKTLCPEDLSENQKNFSSYPKSWHWRLLPYMLNVLQYEGRLLRKVNISGRFRRQGALTSFEIKQRSSSQEALHSVIFFFFLISSSRFFPRPWFPRGGLLILLGFVCVCVRVLTLWSLSVCVCLSSGYPAGYPTTAPAYTSNIYQTGTSGYPPGKALHIFPYIFVFITQLYPLYICHMTPFSRCLCFIRIHNRNSL